MEAAQMAATKLEPATLIAVASKGGGRINQHFGHATEFQIYEVDSRGARFVGHRRVDRYCGDRRGDDAAMAATLAALEGVSALLCAKIGERPRERLAAAGITASDAYAFEYIEASAIAWRSIRFASSGQTASA
jgi:nitrogen fixation protein NifB